MTMPKRLTTLDRPTDQALNSHRALIDTLLVLTGLTIEEALNPNTITNRPTNRLTERRSSQPASMYMDWGDPQDVCGFCYMDTAINCDRYGCMGIPGEREFVAALMAGDYDDAVEAARERDELLEADGIGTSYDWTELLEMELP